MGTQGHRGAIPIFLTTTFGINAYYGLNTTVAGLFHIQVHRPISVPTGSAGSGPEAHTALRALASSRRHARHRPAGTIEIPRRNRASPRRWQVSTSPGCTHGAPAPLAVGDHDDGPTG
jgi:hypothetical protein